MPKFVFSTDDLPADVPNSARADAWAEHYEKKLGRSGIVLTASPDQPLQARIEIVPVNNLAVASISGSINGLARTKSGIVADGSDALVLVLNSGATAWRFNQHGREIFAATGCSTLYSDGLTGSFSSVGHVNSTSIRIPRQTLASVIAHPEDMIARPIDMTSEPFRMLSLYTNAMLTSGEVNEAATLHSVSAHIVDLIGLSLMPQGETARSGTHGSLRTARLHELLGAIKAGYRNPAFTIKQIADKQRVSSRYLQQLLQETGVGFGDRILELRLLYACDLLARADTSHRKIIDIAFSSGFSDLSYFHRCFRRRFGMTPADARPRH